MMFKRYLEPQIVKDLLKKMVFVAGPRQVGKTTLAMQVAGTKGYLNWDIAEQRERILAHELPEGDTLVLDEIHKYRSWRNYIKGLYDSGTHRILVTGSARLDIYRFGGDSLQGRYHFFRLHPLSVAELKLTSAADFMELLMLGGYPEPFFGKSAVEAKRWSREYRTRLIREDLTSLEQLHDLGNLELLMLRLPKLVGSPLSLNALREDLQISHKTIAHWMDILERLYAIFRLSPLGTSKIRAVKKERKHYHYDWSLVTELPQRFENLMAHHLLKWVHFEEDRLGRDIDLQYFRDSDGREVDFIITENGQPITLIECKWGDAPLSKHLAYLKHKFPIADAWQLHATGTKDYQTPDKIRVAPALLFLKGLV
ncbi:MAG: ATP-binding protein [Deltaproteobacteria bacterium]|nr:ATP-binding protein [Deltaproteobacteria bacterium]